MTTINVGLQSDGYVAVDFGDEGWQFNQLTIQEAKFLHEELTEALQRAEKRFPNGTPPEDTEKDRLLNAARAAVAGDWWEGRPQMDVLAKVVDEVEEDSKESSE